MADESILEIKGGA
jgi:hypothetical protein